MKKRPAARGCGRAVQSGMAMASRKEQRSEHVQHAPQPLRSSSRTARGSVLSMGFFLLVLVGLGVAALSRSGQGGVAAPSAIDPATANPALGGPRTQTINGVVIATAPWTLVALSRLGRYAPTTPGVVSNPSGFTTIQGALRFTQDTAVQPLPDDTGSTPSVLTWVRTQNSRSLSIVTDVAILNGPFTEAGANATRSNPFLPRSITLCAVPLLSLPTVAGPTSGRVVLAAAPGSL